MKNYPIGTEFYRKGVLKYTLVNTSVVGGIFRRKSDGVVQFYPFSDPLYYDLYPEQCHHHHYDVIMPKHRNFTNLYDKLQSR